MPRGPKGERHPADVNGNAVKVMRIATGEETEELPDDGKDPAARALGKKGGAGVDIGGTPLALRTARHRQAPVQFVPPLP